MPTLKSRGHESREAVRGLEEKSDGRLRSFVVGNIDGTTGWSKALQSAEAVIHLAARVHVIREAVDDTLAEFRHVNTEGTINLARQSASAGVRRFIFLSTIGVNGSSTLPRKVFAPSDTPSPHDPYSMSKYEAEIGLDSIAQSTGMELVIIRPPLVYGPKNPGNMARLFKVTDTGIPLPLTALGTNIRSFVGVSNLIDLILHCLVHPAAANQTFHVSDDDDISTAELLRRMGKALGKPVRNLPIPQTMLKTGLRLIGKGEWVDKLCGDLRVDISETKRVLGWKPKVTMEEELERTAKWWREREK
jgi:nucleoside-diphosphate-sugar epimerase